MRLHVAGVNPKDYKVRLSGAAEPFQIPGQDGAGEVVEVGGGVDPARLGARAGFLLRCTPGKSPLLRTRRSTTRAVTARR